MPVAVVRDRQDLMLSTSQLTRSCREEVVSL